MEIEKFKEECKERKTTEDGVWEQGQNELKRHRALLERQEQYGKYYKPKDWLICKLCPSCGKKLKTKRTIDFTKRFLWCSCGYEYAEETPNMY